MAASKASSMALSLMSRLETPYQRSALCMCVGQGPGQHGQMISPQKNSLRQRRHRSGDSDRETILERCTDTRRAAVTRSSDGLPGTQCGSRKNTLTAVFGVCGSEQEVLRAKSSRGAAGSRSRKDRRIVPQSSSLSCALTKTRRSESSDGAHLQHALC